MPFNFDSQDPGIKERPYVSQIPIQQLFQNLGFKQSQYDSGVQQAEHSLDMLANLPSYGQDTQKKQEILNDMNDQLQKSSGQDFGDPRNLSKFQSYVSSVANSPDLQAIAARGHKFMNDQQEMKELQMKGKSVPEWLQPSIQQANNYYKSGKYDPDTRFYGNISVAPDVAKKYQDFVDGLPTHKDSYTNANGEIHTTEYKKPEDIKNGLLALNKLDPELANYHQQAFAAQNASTDWDRQGDDILNQDISRYNQQELAATHILHSSSDPAIKHQALLAIVAAQDGRKEASSLVGNKYNGAKVREIHFNDYLSNDVKSYADTHGYHNDIDKGANEFSKLTREYQLREEEDAKKLAIEAGQGSIDDKGNVTLTPGIIPPKPSGKTTLLNGTTYTPGSASQLIDDAFDKKDPSSLEFFKEQWAEKHKDINTTGAKVQVGSDGVIHIYREHKTKDKNDKEIITPIDIGLINKNSAEQIFPAFDKKDIENARKIKASKPVAKIYKGLDNKGNPIFE